MTICDTIATPVGELLLVAEDEGLAGVRFEPHGRVPAASGAAAYRGAWAVLAAAREQLAAYFAGELTEFTLPLAPQGTPFQLGVWEALRRIRYGETISYAELAQRIGAPRAVRAVGAANGRNPLPVVVPCHRVIGADGSLTGFGGGLDRKRWLLDHEGALGALDLLHPMRSGPR